MGLDVRVFKDNESNRKSSAKKKKEKEPTYVTGEMIDEGENCKAAKQDKTLIFIGRRPVELSQKFKVVRAFKHVHVSTSQFANFHQGIFENLYYS